MCYSKSASFSSFGLGVAVNSLLFVRNTSNDRWAAVVLTSVIFMQFLEGLMWSDLKCKGMNPISSFLAYILLIIVQPLLSILCAFLFSSIPLIVIFLLLLIWFVFASSCFYFAFPTFSDLCSTKSLTNNLSWPWWEKVPNGLKKIYFLLCITPWLYMRPSYQPVIYFCWLLAVYYLSYKKTPLKSSVASVYCFYIAFTGLIPLFFW